MDTNIFFGEYGGRYMPDIFKEIGDGFEEFLETYLFKERIEKLYSQLQLPRPNIDQIKAFENMQHLSFTHDDLCYRNAASQVLLAEKLGKTRIVYSVTDERQAIVTALLCKKLDLSLKPFIAPEIVSERTKRLLSTLTTEETVYTSKMPFPSFNQMYAYQDWNLNREDTYLFFDEAIGPTPFPTIIRSFMASFGEEIKTQYFKKHNKNPDVIIAHLDQASSALGLFYPFLKEKTELILLKNKSKETRTKTVFLGAVSIVRNMHQPDQKIVPPELSYLIDSKRIKNIEVDDEIGDLPLTLREKEGIIFDDLSSYINLNYATKRVDSDSSTLVLTNREL